MYSALQSDLQQKAKLVKEFQQEIKKLKDLSSQIGTNRDKAALRQTIAKERDETKNLSKELLNIFKTPPSRSEKLQHDKLAKEFEALFKQFQALNQELIEKEKTVLHIQEEQVRESISNDQFIQRDTLAFKSVGDLDEAMLKERHNEINQLERDMTEVNTMFKDIAAMVQEQGGMLDGTETNVENTVKETGKAVEELNKADEYQKRSKRKMMCLLAIALVVVVALILIVLGVTGSL